MRSHTALLPFVLLSLPVALPAQQPTPATATNANTSAPPIRLGVVQWLRSNREEEEQIVPPVYSNHLPKSLSYETLVVVDHTGTVRPGLAGSWQRSTDGRRYVFQLRPGATFHDGSPCDAPAAKRYFESWLVRDVDRFVGTCERIQAIEALDAHTLAISLREPWAILCDLALMNPMGIVGGAIVPPHGYPQIGTGPWRVTAFEPMRRMRFERHPQFDGERPLLDAFEWITLIAGADRDPISTWALERGHVDALIESWRPSIPRDLARELVDRGKARLVQHPGAMVQILCFNHERGPFAARSWRRVVRDAVDRDGFVRTVEHGFAQPCTALFAPAIADWPDAAAAVDPPTSAAAANGASPTPIAAEILVVSTDPAQMALAVELARKLRPHGIDLHPCSVTPTGHGRRVAAGDFDLYIARTWGAPYDPQATLYSRFRAATAQRRSVFFADPALSALIDEAGVLDPGPERAAIYGRVQRRLDECIAIVPLYVPDRIALLGPDVDGIELGNNVYAIDLSRLRRRPGG
ncbi:MAG: ABC transporter substrate-binding protein [Planctomycetota bacterium]